jgi:hypothetical protein
VADLLTHCATQQHYLLPVTLFNVRPQVQVPAPHHSSAGHRKAILFMSSDSQALLHHIDRFTNHFLSVLLYANQHDYDVLLYVHRKPVPANTAKSFYFFLKVSGRSLALVKFKTRACCRCKFAPLLGVVIL